MSFYFLISEKFQKYVTLFYTKWIHEWIHVYGRNMNSIYILHLLMRSNVIFKWLSPLIFHNSN